MMQINKGVEVSQNNNPLAAAAPWNLVAGGYVETTMQMLAQYAEEAITALNLEPGFVILDVACGPGSLAMRLAEEVASVHCIDFSEAMLDIFHQNIKRAGLGNILIRHGDAQTLPYSDSMFDAAFSMFGLMFFPDRGKGFSEIHRTLKKGGRIAVTSWAPVDQSPAMQTMFGALRVMKPELPEPQRAVATLENPEVFRQELLDAGFRDVKIQCVTKNFPVETIDSFWDDMVKGSAPIQMLKNSMGIDAWKEKEKLAMQYLHELLPSIPTALASDAWLGTAIK
jgi:ubiquinone/menaquinone biosynthesis C-methylase UbiE